MVHAGAVAAGDPRIVVRGRLGLSYQAQRRAQPEASTVALAGPAKPTGTPYH